MTLGDLSEAVDETLIVNVEVGLAGVTEAGLGVQVIPAGPEQVRATALVKPFDGLSVIVEVADDPLATGLGEGALAVRVNAGEVAAVILTANASDRPWLAVRSALLVVTGKSIEAVEPTT